MQLRFPGEAPAVCTGAFAKGEKRRMGGVLSVPSKMKIWGTRTPAAALRKRQQPAVRDGRVGHAPGDARVKRCGRDRAPVSRAPEKVVGSETWRFTSRAVVRPRCAGLLPCSSPWAWNGLWRSPRYRRDFEVWLKKGCWPVGVWRSAARCVPSPRLAPSSVFAPSGAAPRVLPGDACLRCPRPDYVQKSLK